MAKQFLTNIDLNHNQLVNAVAERRNDKPQTFEAGSFHYDSQANVLTYYNGTEWVELKAQEAVDFSQVDLSQLKQDPTKILESVLGAFATGKDSYQGPKIDAAAFIENLPTTTTSSDIAKALGANGVVSNFAESTEAVERIKTLATEVANAVAEAKANTVKEEILNSASTDYDTLQEVEAAIKRNADAIKLIQGVAKKFAVTVDGDNVKTEHEIAHGLNTTDVAVSIYRDNELVLADFKIIDANTAKVVTGKPLAAGSSLRVVITG